MVGEPRNVPKFANVYLGTSTGFIKDASICLIGCRIVKDEHFGTIKYVGPIADSTVVWLGIDWDSPKGGRHDGTFKGVAYFSTHGPTSGSFLKPEKASLGTSLEEALVTRYGMCAECQMIARDPALFQSGDDPVSGIKIEAGPFPGQLKATMDMSLLEAEFTGGGASKSCAPFIVEIFTNSSGELNGHQTCGAGGVAQRLSSLRIACIPGMPVYRALRKNENLAEDVRTLWPGSGGQMSAYLGALRELDLSSCLISKWTEVANICSQLPLLLKLNVGSNRLRLPPTAENELSELPEVERRLLLDVDVDAAAAETLCSSAFPSLTRFVAVHMLAVRDGGTHFGWSEITRILGWMPSLKEVCIAYNELGDLPDPSMGIGTRLTDLLQNLTEVDLTGTGQRSFSRILSALGCSTSLTSLVLNVNQLKKLAIRDNLINDWESVNSIAQLPSLTNLIISQNPILSRTTPETARQELIARLPRLKSLNRQEVERDERRGAELDFLKRYGKSWAEAEKRGEEAMRLFKENYPGFEQLCAKYGAPESSEIKSVIHALKESLVELTITCEPPMMATSPRKVVKRLPARMTVNHLRSLVRRLFHLPTTAIIDLVTCGARPGFDEVEVPLDSDTRELGFFGVVSGDRLVARWSPESR